MNQNKIKLLTISDVPLLPSGVGNQAKIMIEGLLSTGKYSVRSLGGAIKHPDYRPFRVEEYGDDWVIYPVDGYGNPDILREIIEIEKPDALWFMTDPRFYIWLFEMSDEVRDRGIPMLYNHVWDNYPVPVFNSGYYKCCDFIGTISKLTQDIVIQCGFEDRSKYIPHAVNSNIFYPMDENEVRKKKIELFGEKRKDSFIAFYNSRNARRKMTSDVINTFHQFQKQIGDQQGEKALLVMHTDPHDQEGANLFAVCEMLKLHPDQIVFSRDRIGPEKLAQFYNIADVTMCLSNNEGFGLSSLESLYSGTPVISNRTGGLQEQNRDEQGNEFGVSIIPVSRSLQGSQPIPYIYDDRVSDEDVVKALHSMYALGRSGRKELGLRGCEYVRINFPLDRMISDWDNAIQTCVKTYKEKKNKRIRLAQV